MPETPLNWEFRDTVIPARLIHALREGTSRKSKREEQEVDKGITAKDLLLLMTIETLSNHGKDGCSGKGCYASNDYLAEAIWVHPTYIPQMIKKLVDLCYLLEIFVGSKRYLEVEWFRTAAERAEVPGDYGRKLKKAHIRLVKMADRLYGKAEKPVEDSIKLPLGQDKGNLIESCIENVKSPLSQPKGDLTKNDEKSIKSPLGQDKGQPLGQDKHIAKVVNSISNNTLSRSTTGQRKNPNYRLPGLTFSERLANVTCDKLQQADLLYSIPNLSSWACSYKRKVQDLMDIKNMSKEKAQEYLKEVVEDHLANLSNHVQPRAHAAKTICDRLSELVEARRRRLNKESNGQPTNATYTNVYRTENQQDLDSYFESDPNFIGYRKSNPSNPPDFTPGTIYRTRCQGQDVIVKVLSNGEHEQQLDPRGW